MEVLPVHPMLKVTFEDLDYVRDCYGMGNTARINESLDAVEKWIKKQEHLVEASKHISRDFLERVFLLAKGSIEGTKNKIDKLFTLRGLMSELCLNKTILEFDHILDVMHYVTLPNLCPTDKSRVLVMKFIKGKLPEFDLLMFYRYLVFIGELRLFYDYNNGNRHIVDLSNTNLSLIAKINPLLMKKIEILSIEGYGVKIKGIHLVNAPSFVDKLVMILKQAFSEKVAGRLHVHSSYEELHKHIPKEILPEDFDGDGASIEKLSEQWKEVLKTKETSECLETLEQLVSDESKRAKPLYDEETLGMQGSFRKLNFD